jgi:hypothetical protein
MSHKTETAAGTAPATTSAWHPFVCARAWPNDEIWEAFEAWEPKHVADLVQGPGVVKGAYYHMVTDNLPEVYMGSGICMAYYTARDLDGLFAFLGSRAFADAVAEGSGWFGKFNSVDFEDITGNIYRVSGVYGSGEAVDVPDDAPFVMWQRFEVPEELQPEFDEWRHPHAEALLELPGVLRVRVFEAVREGCPLPYYYSRGNRMIGLEVESVESLLSQPALARMRASLEWDLRLKYVKRDVFSYRYHHLSSHGGETST